jgi:hypothetical protein
MVNYTTNNAPGSTAVSSQGRFETQDGTQLGTTSQSVSMNILNGSGTASETVIISPGIITKALKQLMQNRIYYRRTFISDGASYTAQAALWIVPPSVGAFSLVRMQLSFIQKRELEQGRIVQSLSESETGRATVPRNSKTLKAVADLTYTGSGTLQAQWKVDGQVIGFVNQTLYPGIRDVSIKSPDVPPLPTYDTGRHSVELEITRLADNNLGVGSLQPELGFDEPVIYYFVTEEMPKEREKVDPLELISPQDDEKIPMPATPSNYPEFRWECLDGEYIYQFELYPAVPISLGPSKSSGTFYVMEKELTGEKPLITALTRTGSHVLSYSDVEKLAQYIPYVWRVEAYQGKKLVARSSYRTVYFSTESKNAAE